VEVSGQFHAPVALCPGRTPVPIKYKAGLDPRYGLHGLERIKIAFSCRNSNPRLFSP
jgi:hypothetical protein